MHAGLTRFEIISYLSHPLTLFWTFAYPVIMLAILLALFDDGSAAMTGVEGYRFRTITGLIALTIVSTAIFGFGQALSELRKDRVLLVYATLPVSVPRILTSIIVSRILVVALFVIVFLPASMWIFDAGVAVTAAHAAAFSAAILVGCLFSYALVLALLHISATTPAVVAVANLVNIYALMSADVFVPLRILPEWSRWFVETSPFYHLTRLLRHAFEASFGAGYMLTLAGLAAAALVLLFFFGTRKVLIPR